MLIDSVQSVSQRGRCDRRQNANDRTRFAALVGLRDFNIEVEVVAVHPGPVITRFALQPAPGIKASRITSLAKDLARSLSTVSVRVVDVIPGKTCIGLEIPNEQREIVNIGRITARFDEIDARRGGMLAPATGAFPLYGGRLPMNFAGLSG